jgi:hypothetical protein
VPEFQRHSDSDPGIQFAKETEFWTFDVPAMIYGGLRGMAETVEALPRSWTKLARHNDYARIGYGPFKGGRIPRLVLESGGKKLHIDLDLRFPGTKACVARFFP